MIVVANKDRPRDELCDGVDWGVTGQDGTGPASSMEVRDGTSREVRRGRTSGGTGHHGDII